MKLRALLVACLLLVAFLPSVAWAEGDHGLRYTKWIRWHQGSMPVPLTLASGLAALGQADPNVTVVPPGSNSQAAAGCSNRPDGWEVALPGSNWISTQADCGANLAVGDYQYSTTFWLPSNTAPLRIGGSILADDSVTVQLNGHTLFSGGGFTQASSFASDNASLFNAGTNTLAFIVHNLGGPTGLDFAVNVNAGGAAIGAKENHGQCVSRIAHQTARGRGHGEAVSEAARFTCRGEDGQDD